MQFKISNAELEVMKVVWYKNAPITASEISNNLKQTNNWEETTIRTLINRLTKKGFLYQEKRHVYYYLPAINEDSYMKEQTRTFLNKVYGGKAKKLITSLFEDNYLSQKDIKEIKQFWDNSNKSD